MKKLAILGASYLQKPLVKKAIEMGVEVHCFAWDNSFAVCRDIADYFYPISVLEKDLILNKCKEIQINGIVTIATDICIPTIAYVANQLNLIGNSEKSAYISTNKFEMREAFLKNNVSSPKSIKVENINEINCILNYPLIVKPTDSSGSRGVTKVFSKNELSMAIERAIENSIEKKAVIEEFIEGVEVSVESISWKGNHTIITITDKVTTGTPYFVELEHHQPSQLNKEIQDKIKKETIKALDALKIEYGASHAEFKITPDGKVYIIEVGARMGGDFIGSHLVQLSTGYDFLKAVIEIALNEFSQPIVEKEMFSGIYFLSKKTERLLPYFEKENDFEVQKEYLNKNLVNITNSNDRSGYIIYSANQKIIL